MRKVILILCVLFLSACEKQKEITTAPTHQELGKICTLITTFEEDMVNVSIYYTQNETYPIQNEKDLFEVNDMILRYSSSGLKDITHYPVNKEKSLRQCGINSDVNSIQLATQIQSTDFQRFVDDLKEFNFTYEVVKNDRTFKVAMPNDVYVFSEMMLNNERVYALDFSEKELETYENIQLTQEYKITYGNSEVVISTIVKDHIQKDGSQVINQNNQLIGIGEGYQIFVSLAKEGELAVDYIPIMTLVKFAKNDIHENAYIHLDKNISLMDLKEYQLYETEDYIVYDLNDYFYENEYALDEVYDEVLQSIIK